LTAGTSFVVAEKQKIVEGGRIVRASGSWTTGRAKKRINTEGQSTEITEKRRSGIPQAGRPELQLGMTAFGAALGNKELRKGHRRELTLRSQRRHREHREDQELWRRRLKS
jgi:hypothetical protein